MAQINGNQINDDTSGVYYIPFIRGAGAEDTDHYMVGVECHLPNGKVRYVYLVPSNSSDDGVATVFLYHGIEGDPASDNAYSHEVVYCKGDD